jgi:hypothetical protein
LSEKTAERLRALFRNPGDARAAGQLLAADCGSNLPFCEQADSRSLERIRFAALKLSGGRLDELHRAIDMAKTDWRDLLVAAGFANDPTEHERWQPIGPVQQREHSEE